MYPYLTLRIVNKITASRRNRVYCKTYVLGVLEEAVGGGGGCGYCMVYDIQISPHAPDVTRVTVEVYLFLF